MEARSCLFCNKPFAPNKYSPRQKVCGEAECQKKRQLESMKLWRKKNPNYFKYDESKGVEWLQLQRQRSKQWRDKNPGKVRSYRLAHSQEYRQYMRTYMRQYRQKRKDASAVPSPSPENPSTP
jgi:hypothetical protein